MESYVEVLVLQGFFGFLGQFFDLLFFATFSELRDLNLRQYRNFKNASLTFLLTCFGATLTFDLLSAILKYSKLKTTQGEFL
jgi:hypothetical protein